MAITTTTRLRFRFVSAQDFNTKVSTSVLDPGSLYFVGSSIYLATSENTYELFGGVQVGTAPPSAANAENVWYYDPTTGALKYAIKDGASKKYINVVEALTTVRVDPVTGEVFFGRLDGTEIELPLPKATTIRTSGASDALLATEKAVHDYVSAEIGGVAGGIHFRDVLTVANIGTMLTSGAEIGDMYRVAEKITNPAVFGGSITLYSGDWVIFKENTTVTPFVSGDYCVLRGVENAAVDAGIENEHVLPLSAHGAFLLQELITALEDGKIDLISNADGGKIVTSNSDGSVAESAKTFGSGTLSNASAADTNVIPNEKQVADALALKANHIGSGTEDVILTATDVGGYQRTAFELTSAAAIPASGSASSTVVPNEAQVRASLDAVATNAVLNWLID